ncbi:MAG: tetratricopeptide repeat protein [Planctomycetes bacterium]|nr:tetratricopeptide repeat protein [Planctomycetota bacterium]
MDHAAASPDSLDPQHSASPRATLQRVLGAALGCLLAFPALKLVWPWPREASLEGDLLPDLTGAAIAALATLPIFAVLYALRRAPRPPWILLLVGAGACGLVAASLKPPTDTLEFERWKLLSTCCCALALGGAALDAAGRQWLARSAALVALAALLPAFFDAEHQFSGVLGNTGSISEAALVGAGAGLGLALWDRGAWRLVGGAAAFAFALYAGLAPVFAGAAALALTLCVAVAGARGSRALVGVAALLLAVGFGAGRLMPRAPSAPTTAGAPIAGERNTGGFEVRRLIWARVPALLVSGGLAGVGPGQFAAQFPTVRDPHEIELSSLGRRLPGQETEVQHAHNDYLQAFSDLGPLGGALFLAFAALAAWRALQALRGEEPARAALALGVLAVLAGGLARNPLSANPASATLAFAALGALLGRTHIDPPRPSLGAFAPLACIALALALQISDAMDLGIHGRALREYFERGRDPLRLAFVLDTRPDSVVALGVRARELENAASDAPSEAVAQAWEDLLARRPHSFEAHMQLGLARARLGELDSARKHWERALELDPAHPGALRNLARLEGRDGDLERARELLRRAGLDERRALGDWAVGALADLDIERGWRLFAELDARWSALDADKAHLLARSERSALGEDGANALEGSAHTLWAREHAARGDAAAALRSYRQARRCLARTDAQGQPHWSRALDFEYAAALALAGDVDAARSELGALRPTPRELTALPTWAGQALLDARLLLR